MIQDSGQTTQDDHPKYWDDPCDTQSKGHNCNKEPKAIDNGSTSSAQCGCGDQTKNGCFYARKGSSYVQIRLELRKQLCYDENDCYGRGDDS
jgi:hypothetical protein